MTQVTAAESITIAPDSDLEPWVGVRVRLALTVRGQRYARYGVFTALWHSDGMHTGIGRHVAGYMLEEPHGDCRGGLSCTYLPLDGETTLTLAPLQP